MKGLKKLFSLHLVMLSFVFLFSLAALANEVVPPSGDELQAYLALLIGGSQGKPIGLWIAVVATQGVALLFRSQLGAFAGIWRMLIISGVAIVTGVLSQVLQGMSWPMALMHSTVIAAVQVFVHQIIAQAAKRTTDVPKVG